MQNWKKIVGGCLVAGMLALFGCGGGSSGSSGGGTQKAVSGTVSFPALSSMVAKQVAATTLPTVPTGTVIPPVLTITDLSGTVVAKQYLVGLVNQGSFTYTVTLDSSKNYVFKATWDKQVLRSLADQGTLTLTAVVNITPVSTAAILVAEKNLNLTSGQLGTTAASSITTAQISDLNPAALLTAVGSATYSNLVTAVTTALTASSDPSTTPAVTTALSSAPAYTAPLKFTTAMLTGKTFSGTSTDGHSGTAIYNANGTITGTDPGKWAINASGQLIVTITDGGNVATLTLIGVNGKVFTASELVSNGNTGTYTFTDVTPAATTGFTVAMISGRTFAIPSTDNGQASIHTYVYNANGTWTATGTYQPLTWSGTWSINASGNLIYTKLVDPYDSSSNFGVPQTETFVSYTSTALTMSVNGTTMVMPYATPAATTGFTTAMISGKTFSGTDSTGYFGTSTYNANGTTTGTDPSTWSINASGQLIETIIESGNVVTITLTGVNGKSFTYSVSVSNGLKATGTFTDVAPAAAKTSFTSADFSGKTIYDAEGPVISAPQASAYMRLQWNADGTFQNSDWASSGTPVLGTVAAGGTWQVTSGVLQLNVVGRGASTVTVLSDDTVNRYWRVQKSSGNLTRWYYDQSTAQAQAQAFAASGANP